VYGKTLSLYQDETGRDGIENRTDVGPIDILAVDTEGNFVVFELKLSRGPDYAMGQIARYMGWV
jgi:RecB family endonuclease NucS